MTLLDFRKPPYFMLDKTISYTGRFLGFYATHYHEGHFCHVVGAVDKHDGMVTARHYNTMISINEELAKHAATKCWEELKEGLGRKPAEGSDTSDRQLEYLFDVYDRKRSESKPN